MKSTTKKILASSLGVAGAMAMGTVTAKADTTVTVNAGDSLNGIAQKYNVSADDIATANHLQNKELIFAGQKLIIPTKDKNETPANNTVKRIKLIRTVKVYKILLTRQCLI